ncbi:hypothetical protein ACJ41O_001335 [Fusarium nematophilum]
MDHIEVNRSFRLLGEMWFSARERCYQPLDPSRKQIRLLTLMPHPDRHGPMVGELSIVSLLDSPVYDALSYVWGSSVSYFGLDLDGSPSPIGRNLDNALRHLRLPDRPRSLWVDAVCINQADSEEQSHQVQLMRDVYSRAANVRAWLDQDVDASAQVFRGSGGKWNFEGVDCGPMAAVFRDVYWTRLWIQQEVILASKLVMHFRSTELPAEPFLAFARLMTRAEKSPKSSSLGFAAFERDTAMGFNGSSYSGWKFLGRHYENCRAARISNQNSSKERPEDDAQVRYRGSLMSLFMDSGNLQVTDSKDRVYGMLGVAVDCNPQDITVDYSLTDLEIAGEVFKHFIRVYDNVSFLCCAAVSPSRSTRCTWLPQPDVEGSRFDLLLHTRGAGGAISCETSSIRHLGRGQLALGVRGVLVDRVKATGLHRELQKAPIEDWYADLRSMVLESGLEATMIEAWDKTTLADYIKVVQKLVHGEALGSLTIKDLYNRYQDKIQKKQDRGQAEKGGLSKVKNLYSRYRRKNGRVQNTQAPHSSLTDMLDKGIDDPDISPEDETFYNIFLACFASTQFVTTENAVRLPG